MVPPRSGIAFAKNPNPTETSIRKYKSQNQVAFSFLTGKPSTKYIPVSKNNLTKTLKFKEGRRGGSVHSCGG